MGPSTCRPAASRVPCRASASRATACTRGTARNLPAHRGPLAAAAPYAQPSERSVTQTQSCCCRWPLVMPSGCACSSVTATTPSMASTATSPSPSAATWSSRPRSSSPRATHRPAQQAVSELRRCTAMAQTARDTPEPDGRGAPRWGCAQTGHPQTFGREACGARRGGPSVLLVKSWGLRTRVRIRLRTLRGRRGGPGRHGPLRADSAKKHTEPGGVRGWPRP